MTEDDEVDANTRELARAFGFRILWEVPQGTITEMPNHPGLGSGVMEVGLRRISSESAGVGHARGRARAAHEPGRILV